MAFWVLSVTENTSYFFFLKLTERYLLGKRLRCWQRRSSSWCRNFTRSIVWDGTMEMVFVDSIVALIPQFQTMSKNVRVQKPYPTWQSRKIDICEIKWLHTQLYHKTKVKRVIFFPFKIRVYITSCGCKKINYCDLFTLHVKYVGVKRRSLYRVKNTQFNDL